MIINYIIDFVNATEASLQVVHHYLHSSQKGFQSRLRKRVRNGRATYTFTGNDELTKLTSIRAMYNLSIISSAKTGTAGSNCGVETTDISEGLQ